MELSVVPNYYTNTAYDSSLPKLDSRASRFSKQVPIVKGGITEPLSAYHFEPLEGSDLIGGTDFKADLFYNETHGISDRIKSFRYPRDYIRSVKLKASRYRLYNQSTWTYWLDLIAVIGLYAAIVGAPLGFIALMFLFLISKMQTWQVFFYDVKYCAILAIVGYSTYRILNYIASILPDKKSDYIDRRTGMITFSKNLDKEKSDIPFVDCNSYLFTDNTSGMNKYLLYVDRYYGGCVSISVNTTLDVYLLAAYLKEFMDISKPLPDVPELEAFRDQDPVTAEYDKKIGRNPRYWRDMSLEKLQVKVEEKKQKLRFWFGKDMVWEQRK